jgi:predicted amidohydrolase
MKKDIVKIAGAQIDPRLMKNTENLKKMVTQTKKAAAAGADLVVFPECALPGYVFNSLEEARPFMETIPGPATERMCALARELGVHIIFGMLETEADKCFNAAVLLGPKGIIGKYHKNHLPFLGIDRFVDHGDGPFRVYRTPVGNIGMHICYDCGFPESARTMALLGADILVLPTNFPTRGTGESVMVEHVINTRAFENKVHFVEVDRVGLERGTRFEGHSKIVNAWGVTLAQASGDKEEIIYAEVRLAEARQKHIVIKPGEFEVDYIGDRRPELYRELTRTRKKTPAS